MLLLSRALNLKAEGPNRLTEKLFYHTYSDLWVRVLLNTLPQQC